MTQFSEAELTAAVLDSFNDTPDPRAKFLLQELVKSLHDYVRKTDLTFVEWELAIDFLTRTGQKCTPIRQEFILLSDVLGVSMLVVEHHMDLVRSISDHVIALQSGRLLMQGTAAEVLDSQGFREAMVGVAA